MPFWKKSSPDKVPVASEEKTLYPVLHIINCLKDYRNELVQKEVSSLSEISEIGHSFEDVLSENENVQEKLQEFGSSFSSIEEVSGQFSAVKDTIAQSVDAAQSGVDELRDSSMQVKTYFDEMEHTFEDLQNAIEKIRQSTSKIVSIAEQTNILALNASIEAARAGEQGRGFAVVATQVKKLVDEIKGLTSDVNAGISDASNGAQHLYNSITTSQKALGNSLDKVEATSKTFDEIIRSADGAVTVHDDISGVIGDSKASLDALCAFFEQIKDKYQEVMNHIDNAEHLGTTKSAMFEDIDNMMSQIPLVIDDYTGRRQA